MRDRLTVTMKRELVLTALGGGGMYVNPKMPVLRTYQALQRRGLLEQEGYALDFQANYFLITEKGVVVADELRNRKA